MLRQIQSPFIGLFVIVSGLLCPTLPAADKDEIVDGRWEWSNDIGNAGVIDSVLILHSDGEKLTGTYKNQMHSAEIKEGSIEDVDIWFTMLIDTPDGEIEASFAGEFIDGELAGEISIGRDGETMEVPWEPTRVTRNEDITGTWNFEFTAPDGNEYKPKFVLREKNGKLSGTASAEGTSIELKDVKLSNNKLTFGYTIDYNGADLSLKYTCHPRGHQLVGSCAYEVSGNEGEFPVSAKKQILDKQLRDLVGAWNCAVTGPDGVDYNPILTVQNVDGKLSGRIATNELDMEIKKISLKDGKITFNFITDHQEEGAVNLAWSCTVNGDQLTGQVEYSVAGESGSIDVTGVRIKDD